MRCKYLRRGIFWIPTCRCLAFAGKACNQTQKKVIDCKWYEEDLK
jgi:hypothetical protein